MRRAALSLLLVSFCLLTARAQDAAPALPKPARGFDEGRALLLREAAENTFGPARLIERLLEDADLPELAGFCAQRLTADERTRVDGALKLGGKLKGADAAATLAAFQAASIKPKAVLAALGELVAGGKLPDAVAWLYRRGFNFEVLQRAMNGERIDSIRLRRLLRERAAAGKGAGVLFSTACWEFNHKDAREELGGHYDGAQLVEALLELGWNEADFEAALGKLLPRGLTARHKTLIAWGDARLLWPALSQGLAESEVAKVALSRINATCKADDPRLLALCQRRARVCDRWFRTGGPRVVGAWAGPLPGSNGEPRPPADTAETLATAGPDQFADSLTPALRKHFNQPGQDQLLLVAYSDGSTRMVVTRPGRAELAYAPDTPLAGPSASQLYEGRFTLEGRIAYATLVFGEGVVAAPPEVDLVNLRTVAGGALLSAQRDDGVTLTPMLLRRVSMLVDAP
ncbi:MAG: hypothetical protein KF754_12080 [Planctomycetes bacterium]|nr:hypothetical protein [Planctomycetota bacterium]